MNLQPELRALENNVKNAFWTLIGAVQSHCFFTNATGVSQKFELLDQLIAFVLPLPAKRIRVRAFLDFISRECVGHKSSTGGEFRLMNVGALGGEEPGRFAPEVHIGFRQCYARHSTQ